MRRLILTSAILGFAVIGTSVFRIHQNYTDSKTSGRVLGAHSQLNNPAINVAPPPVRTTKADPGIRAKSVYLIDVNSAYPLYAKNEDAVVPIASTTKLMTALIARQSYLPTDIITIDEKAAAINGSTIQLKKDEQLDVQSLLTGLLLPSGNDAAMALADHMGFDQFVMAMNKQAAYLGMTNTLFKDPAGLDDTGHSSAHDLAVLASYVLRDDVIRSIVKTQQATIVSKDGKITHKLENSNRLIKPENPLFLADATGLKTGFTPDAGHCLVSSATRSGNSLVSVVLNTDYTNAEASALESKKLLTWGFDSYVWNSIDHN